MRKMMKEHDAIKFLLDSGLLFEINRSVLHPFGLALAVKIDDDGNCKFDGLWDCRDDPEGIVFDDEVLAEGSKKYHEYMVKEGFDKKAFRYNSLGYVCQIKYDKEIIMKKSQELKEKLFGESEEGTLSEEKSSDDDDII
jgi:hypothetical protein